MKYSYSYSYAQSGVEVKVYPRLMHALKCLHAGTFSVPKTNKGMKLRFEKIKQIARRIRYLNDTDLTGYRVEVVVRGNVTLNEAQSIANPVLEQALPTGVVIANSVTPDQYKANLVRVITKIQRRRVFRGRSKTAPTKAKKQHLASLYNALGYCTEHFQRYLTLHLQYFDDDEEVINSLIDTTDV